MTHYPHEADERRGLGIIFLVVGLATLAGCLVVSCRKARGQPPPNPLGVQPTAEMIALGRELFFDPILSADNTVSCASCHDPAKGWADGLPKAVGIGGRTGTINTPSILNAAHDTLQFRNGRTVGIATQALLPLENRIEMGGPGNEAAAVRRLTGTPKYVRLFANAFGTAPTAQGLGLSIAAFETTITTTDTLANRRIAGQKALTPDAEIGFKIFVAANCMKCHSGPLFRDGVFHNNGSLVGFTRGDQGRFAVTRLESDRRKFKTPSLIGVARTAPYMHDGRFPTLRSVLVHYNRGGVYDGKVDRLTEILPLGLTKEQLDYLEVFIREGFEPMEWPK